MRTQESQANLIETKTGKIMFTGNYFTCISLRVNKLYPENYHVEKID